MCMTSLERIKEITESTTQIWGIGARGHNYLEDVNFILKAFQVMRDIAARRSGYNWVDLDKEFEEGMR